MAQSLRPARLVPAAIALALVTAAPGDVESELLIIEPWNQSFGPGRHVLQPGPAADVTGDGAVDVDDLVAVILAWGDCPSSGPCPADVTADGRVDVGDLVAVILPWS